MQKESQEFTAADVPRFFNEIVAEEVRHTSARLRAASARRPSTRGRPGRPGRWAAEPGVFQQIDHVGIAGDDLEAGIARYRELMGVEPSVRKSMHKDGIDAAMLDLGSTHVELIAPSR